MKNKCFTTIFITALALSVLTSACGGNDERIIPELGSFAIKKVDPPEGTPLDKFTLVQVTFTAPVDEKSFEKAFSMTADCSDGFGKIKGEFSYTQNNYVAIFRPESVRIGCAYIVSISSAAKAKLNGAPLTNPLIRHIIGYKTASHSIPGVSPIVRYISPPSGSTCVQQVIAIRFSEPMDPAGMHIRLVQKSTLTDQSAEIPLQPENIYAYTSDLSVWYVLPPIPLCEAFVDYQLIVSRVAYDLDGERMQKDYKATYHGSSF